MREVQLEWCRKCQNRKVHLKKGLVCGLTGEQADFQTTCPDYVLDEEAEEDVKRRDKARADISNTEKTLGLSKIGIKNQAVAGAILTSIGLVSVVVFLWYGRLFLWGVALIIAGLVILIRGVMAETKGKKKAGNDLLDDEL